VGFMKSIVYKIAIFVSVISLVTSLLSGISIITSLIRSGMVFLATLVVIIIALNLLRWSLNKSTTPVVQTEKMDK